MSQRAYTGAEEEFGLIHDKINTGEIVQQVDRHMEDIINVVNALPAEGPSNMRLEEPFGKQQTLVEAEAQLYGVIRDLTHYHRNNRQMDPMRHDFQGLVSSDEVYLVELSAGNQTIFPKWVFSYKTDLDDDTTQRRCS